jgi:hypothetical protein
MQALGKAGNEMNEGRKYSIFGRTSVQSLDWGSIGVSAKWEKGSIDGKQKEFQPRNNKASKILRQDTKVSKFFYGDSDGGNK